MYVYIELLEIDEYKTLLKQWNVTVSFLEYILAIDSLPIASLAKLRFN